MLNYHSTILILGIIIVILSIYIALRHSSDESYLFLNEDCYNEVYNSCDYLRNTTDWRECIQETKETCTF
jgi:hypothetical protein